LARFPSEVNAVAVYRLGASAPESFPSSYVAPGAILIGDVRLAARASVWFGTVLRANNESIRISPGRNVQESLSCMWTPGSRSMQRLIGLYDSVVQICGGAPLR